MLSLHQDAQQHERCELVAARLVCKWYRRGHESKVSSVGAPDDSREDREELADHRLMSTVADWSPRTYPAETPLHNGGTCVEARKGGITNRRANPLGWREVPELANTHS